jgi:hypothetical protein
MQVAIKIVRAKPGEEPIIMREGIVLSLIDSPWVPSCFDYGITDDHFCYFVLSFVPGTTLDLVESKDSGLSRGQLPWPEVSKVHPIYARIRIIYAHIWIYRHIHARIRTIYATNMHTYALYPHHLDHPTPYTLHPTPYILHPIPYTLYPTLCTRRPKPQALLPSHCTFHPTLLTSETLNP